MAIVQKHGIFNVLLTGNGSGTAFKLDLSLAPILLDTKGNQPSAVAASVTCPADTALAVSSTTIAGDRVTLNFNHAWTGDASVNLILTFDSK